MKKLLGLLFLALAIIGCSQEEPDPIDPPFEDTRLAAIQQGDQYITFSYNDDNRVKEVNSTINTETAKWKYFYSGDMVTEAFHYYNGEFTDKITVAYNLNNEITQIKKYYFENSQFVLNLIIEPTYGDNALPSTIVYKYPDTQDQFTKKLSWENGNLTKVQHLDNEDQLRFEFFYSYDDHPNYRLANPYFIEAPESSSLNNIKRMEAKDYTGTLDISCNPCSYEYEYNNEGLPTSLSLGGATSEQMFYEQGFGENQPIWKCGI